MRTSYSCPRLAQIVGLLCLLLVPVLSYALPKALSVPGGVALIRLGAVTTPSDAPRAWLGDQPVLVAAENGQWTAVVGLALDLPIGSQELRVEDGGRERSLHFDVGAKKYPEQRIRLKDSGKVQLSPDDETRALGEIATIQNIKRHWRKADDTETRLVRPVEGRLASRFGLRRVFNGEPRAPHVGLDLAVPRGISVKASAPGLVLAVGDFFSTGKRCSSTTATG